MKEASTYKEPLGGQMGKITGKLKHTFNAFPDLQTKFLHKQCVIWTILQSFNEFHQNIHILQISGTILQQLRMRKKVTTRSISH